MKYINKALLYVLSFFIFPYIVRAHIIGGTGFSSGAIHPLSGLDHLLAMIAVGIISTRHGGKTIWLIPLSFVFFMIVGGFIGMAGAHIAFVEIGIALSVLFLGVAIFLQKKFPLHLTLLFVAVSAILHGHAHGSEMPLIASPMFYAFGFVVSTAFLHMSGVATGHLASKTNLTTRLLRYAGAGVSISGLFFLTSL